MARIGVCGTGKMGSEITKRLLECGQDISAVSYTHLTLPTKSTV